MEEGAWGKDAKWGGGTADLPLLAATESRAHPARNNSADTAPHAERARPCGIPPSLEASVTNGQVLPTPETRRGATTPVPEWPLTYTRQSQSDRHHDGHVSDLEIRGCAGNTPYCRQIIVLSRSTSSDPLSSRGRVASVASRPAAFLIVMFHGAEPMRHTGIAANGHANRAFT